MPNYGDVALNLPPDWSRGRMVGSPDFMLTAIGHENGVPDVFLTDHPEARNQFTWCDPRDQSRTSVLRTQHYIWVNKADWTKNPDLWEWDGDGFILHNGQRLMARDESHYNKARDDAERATKEREGRQVSSEEEQAVRRLQAQGAIIEDERGRQLTPLSPKR